ncbi:MAG: HAD family phosphatase [Luteolibacter sp.]
MDFLFDIGRVLLGFDFEPSLARLLPADTADSHQRLSRLLERKDEFEAGKVDVDTYTVWALNVLESTATADEFHHAWRDIFTPNEPMWRWVRELKKAGHRLILFSNINGIHSPWIYDEFPEFSIFDGAVMSFEIGYIKPQPEMYRYAIEKFMLSPERTIYIDDLPENCATGRELGFRTWQYDLKKHGAFEHWLKQEMSCVVP